MLPAFPDKVIRCGLEPRGSVDISAQLYANDKKLRHLVLGRRSERDIGASPTSPGSLNIDRRSKHLERREMNAGAMTAAHRTLPFGTKVTVVNHRIGRSKAVAPYRRDGGTMESRVE